MRSIGLGFDQVTIRPGGRSCQIRTVVMEAVRAEIISNGFRKLSHAKIATQAGVDRTTLYRRWPTVGRLVADLMGDCFDEFVPVPNLGRLDLDFQMFLKSIVSLLRDPNMMRLIQAFFAASLEGDEVVSIAIGEVWRDRFSRTLPMLDRAIGRGEIPIDLDRESVVEALVSPVWFRLLISRMPVDEIFLKKTADSALQLAGHQSLSP